MTSDTDWMDFMHIYVCIFVCSPDLHLDHFTVVIKRKNKSPFTLNKSDLCFVIYVRRYLVDACICVLVRVSVSHPEVVDLIVETLLVVFTKGVCSSTPSRP